MDTQRPGCPIEYLNIQIKGSNEEKRSMPFKRSRYDKRTGFSPNNPRQQLNEATPFIDGSAIYGTSKTWTDCLREFKGGRLKADNPYKKIYEQFPTNNDMALPFVNYPTTKLHMLRPVSRYFKIGNRQGFENPFLLAISVIWFRWHNYIAHNISHSHPEWDDEKIFQAARRKVIAYQQKITMYDFLPRLLKIDENLNTYEIPKYTNEGGSRNVSIYNGYRSDINPAIAQEFQSAAMRFGHTIVPPGIWVRGPKRQSDCNWGFHNISLHDRKYKTRAIRLCNQYWNSQNKLKNMFDSVLRGMASSLASMEDTIMEPDLREFVYGPLEFSRRDLAAIDIQRGRDHGVSDYLTVRKTYCGHMDTLCDYKLKGNKDIVRVHLI
ncbi:hypothetical protein FSP39_000360 [Pinctada imbricata]|uniref:Uncharacterized protein n=1 Tax=Pinctada imbricata TaxID=66713 RepID=A0AA88XGP1_PINIB|nr:hypothetical protein FSP39_000360 [Pinctada imbricata]